MNKRYKGGMGLVREGEGIKKEVERKGAGGK